MKSTNNVPLVRIFEAILWIAAIRRIAIIAFIAIIGLGITACGNGSTGGSDTPRTAKYVSVDEDGDTWTLTIKEKTGRFSYSPQKGDTYVLEIDSETDGEIYKSKGQVQSNTNGKIKMKPANATETFEVTTNADGMTSVEGTITFDDGRSQAIPSPFILTPSSAPSGPSGGALPGYIGNTLTLTGQVVVLNILGQPGNYTGSNTLRENHYDQGETGSITNGIFNFSCGVPTLNDNDIIDWFVDDLTHGKDWQNVTITPATGVKCSYPYQYFYFNDAFTVIRRGTWGSMVGNSSLINIEAIYVYVDNDVVIKGDSGTGIYNFRGDYTFKAFTLSLKKGWNRIYEKETLNFINSAAQSGSIELGTGEPDGMKWVRN